MPTGPVATSTVVEAPSTPTLGEFLADQFGDLPDVGESPGSSSSAAGAPPAEHATTSAVGAASGQAGTPGQEGATAAALHAGDTPADASQATPDDAPIPIAAADADPLAGATSLTYTVDGQARTYEDIKVLGEHGGIIDKAALPKLQQRLSERDHLFEQGRAQHAKLQELERLTEWKHRDPQGNEVTVTGRQGIEQQRVLGARAIARLQTLSSVFGADPLKFLTVAAGADGQPVISWNKDELEHLGTRAQLAENNAEQIVRSWLGSIQQTAQQEVTRAQDLERIPATLWQSASTVWGKEFPTLTPDDKTHLQAQVPRYTREANADEVRSGQFKQGEWVLDRAFYDLMSHTAGLRKQGAQQVQTATAASSENAAKLAAAARGVRQVPSAPIQQRRQQVEPDPREQQQSDWWDQQQRASARAIRSAS